MKFSVCVYCGSRTGHSDQFQPAALALGRAIATRGWRLVYGGGNVGLMGAVADAALAQGGEVIGVIPERLVKLEVGHQHLTELRIVPSMHDRKRQMAELSDMFIALPGGIGTLEELFEVWTWRHLGYHRKPIGLFNVAGFFDPLLGFLDHTRNSGFIDSQQQSMLTVRPDAQELLDRLAVEASEPGHVDDFSRI